jgi:hypothetical protein
MGLLQTGAGPIRELEVAFPRPVETLHQIEITSRCNLRCSYCPSPHLGRPKVDMTEAHFARALEWVKALQRAGTQGRELNLAGIGESTLHPAFPCFLALARATLGDSVDLVLATNGLIADAQLAALLAQHGVQVWVSLHRPERALRAVHFYRAAGVLRGISADPSLSPNSWAGQIPELVKLERRDQFACPWLREGWVMAMADGRVTTCCLDADGSGVVGHLDDDPTTIRTRPYRLCRDCYQVIGVRGYDQRKGETDGTPAQV